ncbi:DinB family protein [Spirosoma rhododendri]|uniref:DinB family protein n=1 Tax=Spirosoma rhododendri TaxID=2728024 RepID=A0A7L5DM09_9BACT|nr:DinB family protein [Spirosoma rhododendri]QJD77107.1 DinB family protein [Spirosoma rhododendri]
MENLSSTPVTGPVTPAERDYIVTALQTTQQLLHEAVDGLTDAQLTFKPNADRWSIAECVEHIVLVERGIFRAIQYGMSLPAKPEKRSEIKVSDVDLVRATRGRSRLLAAPEPFVPTGKYGDTSATVALFDQVRTADTDFAQTAEGDLRTHYFDHFILGRLDLYQALLLIASHGERHRKQIDDVKATPGYPQS